MSSSSGISGAPLSSTWIGVKKSLQVSNASGAYPVDTFSVVRIAMRAAGRMRTQSDGPVFIVLAILSAITPTFRSHAPLACEWYGRVNRSLMPSFSAKMREISLQFSSPRSLYLYLT